VWHTTDDLAYTHSLWYRLTLQSRWNNSPTERSFCGQSQYGLALQAVVYIGPVLPINAGNINRRQFQQLQENMGRDKEPVATSIAMPTLKSASTLQADDDNTAEGSTVQQQRVPLYSSTDGSTVVTALEGSTELSS